MLFGQWPLFIYRNQLKQFDFYVEWIKFHEMFVRFNSMLPIIMLQLSCSSVFHAQSDYSKWRPQSSASFQPKNYVVNGNRWFPCHCNKTKTTTHKSIPMPLCCSSFFSASNWCTENKLISIEVADAYYVRTLHFNLHIQWISVGPIHIKWVNV